MTEIKICSHCNQEIENEDKLILCASCQKPYHKECWTKCKCFINCGIDNFQLEHSISNYSNENISQENENKIQYDDLSEELKYVGYKNLDYYRHAFTQINDLNSTPFNFAACFFPAFWLLYRKLYIEYFAVLGINLVVQNISIKILDIILSSQIKTVDDWYEMSKLFSELSNVLAYIIGIIIAIAIGLIGNKLYFKKIKRLKSKNKDYDCGGTSIVKSLFIGLAITTLFVLVEILLDIIF